MSRPIRINLPHSLYHVMSRTNTGDLCFTSDRNFKRFFKYLDKYCRIFEFKVHAYCLMPNHFHLLLESGSMPELSEFMRRLLTAYTLYYNKYDRRHGHLFQGRFKSYLVDKVEYLLAVSRYIHLNPVKESDLAYAQNYKGSSLRHYINGSEPDFLKTNEILSWFDGDRKAYAKFVREGLNEDTKPEILQQKFIGGKKFVTRINKRLKLMKQSGSRSTEALAKIKNVNHELNEKQSEKILKETARYFEVTPSDIVKKRPRSRASKKAKTVLVILLRDHVAWTNDQVAHFTGLKNQNSIPYHLRKVKEKDIERAIIILEDRLNLN